MKRIVLFVEGEGESDAVPKLVKRLLTEQNAWDAVTLDPNPFRVGQVNNLLKDGCREWTRKLNASRKRRDVGGVLLLLDGDVKVRGGAFCPFDIAKTLSRKATESGAGTTFSVAVVFAQQEYESWLISGIGSLAGKRLSDGRLIDPRVQVPDGDIEREPRDAKGWLAKVVNGGYKPTRDQAAMTDLLDIDAVRSQSLRSFRRLESALKELVHAIRNDKHVATPAALSEVPD